MDTYQEKVIKELKSWERKIQKRPSMTGKYVKKVQTKMNSFIPDKVHHVMTTSIKSMVQATLVGSEYTTKKMPLQSLSLEEREKLVLQKLNSYKKTAAAEGAGTGAGGILLGLADFPLLLGIKMKFLFDVASIYGFDVTDYRERLYILHLFQLAFSSDEKRIEVFDTIVEWDEIVGSFPEKEVYLEEINWKAFQLEYRDHIDLIKMLQMIPGFGAVVGALANYHFLDVLGETAMNGYRLRLLKNNR
ncbi:EcsC family protein [Anaerobacillus sp. MEB173]|uniref:EcsC family protein n=1 Tax=Anaerobacillus sp. MEB173 TaxID=3383345 RepID=UPI003F93ED9A